MCSFSFRIKVKFEVERTTQQIDNPTIANIPVKFGRYSYHEFSPLASSITRLSCLKFQIMTLKFLSKVHTLTVSSSDSHPTIGAQVPCPLLVTQTSIILLSDPETIQDPSQKYATKEMNFETETMLFLLGEDSTVQTGSSCPLSGPAFISLLCTSHITVAISNDTDAGYWSSSQYEGRLTDPDQYNGSLSCFPVSAMHIQIFLKFPPNITNSPFIGNTADSCQYPTESSNSLSDLSKTLVQYFDYLSNLSESHTQNLLFLHS